MTQRDDRTGRQPSLRQAVAARIYKARTHDAVQDGRSRNLFQLLGHGLAQSAPRAAAMGAIAIIFERFVLPGTLIFGAGITAKFLNGHIVQRQVSSAKGHPQVDVVRVLLFLAGCQ